VRSLIVVLSYLVIPHIASAADDCGNLSQAQWLIGHWTSDEAGKHYDERWVKVSDATFEGQGVTTRASDQSQVDGESLRLAEMGDGVFYIAKVAHNPFPLGFRMMRCEARTLVFENQTHNFPKRLEYELQDENTLRVRVSDGADKGFTLIYHRSDDTK
jgi:hypothetical protein